MKYFSVVLILSIPAFITAQPSDKLKEGIKFYTDAGDSSKFIKLNLTNQIWARYTENNPNTVVQGRSQTSTTDFSIRRIRLVLSGRLSSRASFFIQFGQNSLNYESARKAGSFFHDITADYAVIKRSLSVGFGLNGWNGPSRFSNTSVASITTLDPPNYQEVTNDTYDQFVRRLGVYVKGKILKVDYRLSIGKPFVIQTATAFDPINKNATFSTLPPEMVYQGYVMYQFLDEESNFGPSLAGTYLGAKRVFNLGGGFFYQKNAMFRLASPADTSYQNILLYAIDLFYDAPLNKEKQNAISLYACYSNYDYGNNFLKVSGPNNPASGTAVKTPGLFDKANYGNAFPYLGSGKVVYIQAAYKLKKNLLKDRGTLQFYTDCQYSRYQALTGPMLVADAGINWLIRGHNTKFTLNYQNRPFFALVGNTNLTQRSRKGCLVLQYQLSF